MRQLLIVLALVPLAGWPQPPGGWHFPEDAEDKPWEEQKLQLPPAPREENLVRLNVDGPTSFDFFVDLASVSVGKDGVVRYTLAARSASGATNISFEGIRCDSRQRKYYAFGRKDGTWAAARNPRWDAIPLVQANRYYAALANDYFCSGRLMAVRDSAEARRALLAGGNPRAAGSNPDVGSAPR